MVETSYKLVLMGLDNAGKTSIILSMAWKYERFDMKPTTGIERSDTRILGFPVYRWDLGGQEKYRKTYLQERSYALNETDLLFYVIDIADEDRYEESLKYYKEILEYLNKIKLNPPIILFFHKADPNFVKTDDYDDSIKHLTDLFIKNSQNFQVETFSTSVYDRKTLVEAFSHSLSKIFPKLNALNALLEEFIANHELSAAMLFDDNFHLIGRTFKDEQSQKDRLKEIYEIYYLFEGFTRLRKYGYELDLNLIKTKGKAPYQIKGRPIHLGDWDLFILLAGQEIVDVEKLLNTLKKEYEAKKGSFEIYNNP